MGGGRTLLWERCPTTGRALYFPVLGPGQCLAGGAGWPILSPKHAGSSWERSLRGVAVPLLCQHYRQLRVMYLHQGVTEGGMGGVISRGY